MKGLTIGNKRRNIKKEFPNLTEDEELLTRLQEKLNKNKHEIRKWLSLMG
jgi:cytochrome c-type biogenesis protein CcmH/NrfG